MGSNPQKKAVVVHSGGMDSSLCLYLARKQHGADQVLSLSFDYGQRHKSELEAAKKLCDHWSIEHQVLSLSFLPEITNNALINSQKKIEHLAGQTPNTLVVGRNGLMARVAGIVAYTRKAQEIFMGVMELEVANSGYRDCSRSYMDLIQEALRIDFANNEFNIVTPLVYMTKKESLELTYSLGVLNDLLQFTITCYEGLSGKGCGVCPACKLKNEGLKEFLEKHPELNF